MLGGCVMSAGSCGCAMSTNDPIQSTRARLAIALLGGLLLLTANAVAQTGPPASQPAASQAVASQPSPETLQAEGDLLFGRAKALYKKKEFTRAGELFRQAADIFDRVPNPVDAAHTYGWLGDCYQEADDVEQAVQRYGEAVRRFKNLNHDEGSAVTSRALGRTLYRRERYAEALAPIEAAGRAFERLEKPVEAARMFDWLGRCHRERGDDEASVAAFAESARRFEAIHEDEALAGLYRSLGESLSRLNRFDEAASIAEKAAAARTRVGGEQHWRTLIARNWHETLKRVAGLPQENQYAYVEGNRFFNEAFNLDREGKLSEAATVYHQAHQAFEAVPDPIDAARAQRNAGKCYLDLTLNERAAPLLSAAVQTLTAQHYDPSLALAAQYLGECLAQLSRPAKAAEQFGAAAQAYDRTLQPIDAAEAYQRQGDCLRGAGQTESAVTAYAEAARRFCRPPYASVAVTESLSIWAQLQLVQAAMHADRGEVAEAEGLIKKVLASAGIGDRPDQRALAYTVLAKLSRRRGANELAAWNFSRAIRLAAPIAERGSRIDKLLCAAMCHSFASLLYELDRFEQAISLYQAAGEAYRAIGDVVNGALMYKWTGNAYVRLANPDEAVRCYDRQLADLETHHDGADHIDVVQALERAGSQLLRGGYDSPALTRLERALALRAHVAPNDVAATETLLLQTGLCKRRMLRFAEALGDFEAALASAERRTKDDDRSKALAHSNASMALLGLGRIDDAHERARAALDMLERLGIHDDAAVVDALSTVGLTLRVRGAYEEALAYIEQAVALARRIDLGGADVAALLKENAMALITLNRLTQAVARSEEALALVQKHYAPDSPQAVPAAIGVAQALTAIGRYSEALTRLNEAEAMAGLTVAGRTEILLAQALCLAQLDRFNAALQKLEAHAALIKEHFGEEFPDLGVNLVLQALVLFKEKSFELSNERVRRGIELWSRTVSNRHPALLFFRSMEAHTLLKLGRPEEALTIVKQVRSYREHAVAPLYQLYAAARLGECYAALDRPADAVSAFDEAIALIEEVRKSLRAVDEADRASFFEHAELFRVYEEMVRAQMKLGRDTAAFRYLERGRARGLLDLLERSESDPLQGVRERARQQRDTEMLARIDGILAQVRQTEERATRLEYELARARNQPETGEDEGRERIERITSDLLDARQAQRAAGRRWFQLVSEKIDLAAPAEPAQIQQLLGPDERMLVYSITDQDGLVFLVRPSGGEIQGYALTWPDEGAVTRETLALSVDQYVSAMKREGYASQRAALALRRDQLRRLPDADAVRDAHARQLEIAIEELTVRMRGLDRDIPPEAQQTTGSGAGRRLFHGLVPHAVWEEVAGASAVFVIPHGGLNRLPMETLIVGPLGQDGKRRHWLDEGPPIVYSPSASTLLHCRDRRREQEAQLVDRATLQEAVLLGDPIFSRAEHPVDAEALPQEGVLVLDVPADSAGAAARLARGDVILAYDAQPVGNHRELRDRIAETEDAIEAGEREAHPVVVRLWRAGRQREISIGAGKIGAEMAKVSPSAARDALQAGVYDPRVMAVERSGLMSRYGGLQPLPGTRREVVAIYETLSGRKYEASYERAHRDDLRFPVTVLLSEDATNTELYTAAPSARILHLATHQIADETDRVSFSSLALTLPPVPTPGDSGFLRLRDLLEHWRDHINRCELVVLSACETQRGRLQRDEGVFAMPWGFMYAGAPAVIASLWRVDDASTAELMSAFYAGLAASGEGPARSKLAAFTAARKALRKQYPEPYFWAPFIYIGDPR